MPLAKQISPVLQRGHPLAQGLVFGLPMFEGAGNSLFDPVGNRSGVFTSGSPTWTGGAFGSCLKFLAGSEYVNFNPLPKTLTRPLTFSFWRTGGVSGSDLSILSATDYHNFLVYERSGTSLSVFDSTGGEAQWTGPAYDGLPHLFTIVVTGHATFYQDGAFKFDGGGFLVPSIAGLRIGASSLTSSTAAKIDNVLIWNRALSASEVAQLYFDTFVMFRKPSRWWEVPATAGAFTNRPGPRIGPALPFGLAIGGAYGAAKALERNPIVRRRALLRGWE